MKIFSRENKLLTYIHNLTLPPNRLINVY